MEIWFVNAFACQPFSGNPAAVVLGASESSIAFRQQLAGELNLPVTAFIQSLSKKSYRIQWFTPTTELSLCGHGTLACAHVIFQQVREDRLILDSQSGKLAVTCSELGYTLDFPAFNPIDTRDPRQFSQLVKEPIVSAYLGNNALLIELTDEAAIRRFEPDFDKIKKIDYGKLIITAKSSGTYDFVSRVFCPQVGINEDQVTGSAHCILGPYWQKKLGKNDFFAFQASARGGELIVQVAKDRVLLTGSANTYMQGNWIQEYLSR